MHFQSDYATTHEDYSYRYQAPSFVPSYTQLDPSWTIDPALRGHQNEHHRYPVKGPMRTSQADNLTYYPSPASSVYFVPLQTQDAFNPGAHSDWPTSFEPSRHERYHSPGGPFGGTLSDISASEYTLSSDHIVNSLGFVANQTEQSFHFAPSASENLLEQHNTWSHKHPMASIPTPPSDAGSGTHAIAMRELEVQAASDYQFQAQEHEDEEDEEGESTVNAMELIPFMQAPEELELSDISTTLMPLRPAANSSRSNEQDMSENDASMQDYDSDSSFDPRGQKLGKHTPLGHTHSRTGSQLRAARRSSTTNPRALLNSTSKVRKSSSLMRHPSPIKDKSRLNPATSVKKPGGSTSSDGDKPPKCFPCTFHAFGCSSVFANKNEWKRHVLSQHLQLSYFRCDLGDCNPTYNPRLISRPKDRPRGVSSGGQGLARRDEEEDEREVTYNDFNRRDLFTQHCRRMHGPQSKALDTTTRTYQRITERARRLQLNSATKTKPKVMVTKDDEKAFEEELEGIRDRCWTFRRKAPTRASCGFCTQAFCADRRGSMGDHDDLVGKAEEQAWEERMEHVGRHYERDGFSAQDERIDEDLRQWGLEHGVLHVIRDPRGVERVWLVGYEPPCAHGDRTAATAVSKGDTVKDRDSQRRRAPRRPVSDTRRVRVKAEVSDSDTDADAEHE